MATHFQLVRWAAIVLFCVLVTTAGLAVFGTALDENGSPDAVVMQPRPLDPSQPPVVPSVEAVGVLLPFDGDAMGGGDPVNPGERDRSQYDNMVVEIRTDGTLYVLGERMEVEAFRSLLSVQMREQLRTMVMIHPDDECVFRNVGPVISVCQEAGIPYRTVPKPDKLSSRVPLEGPA